MEVQITTFRNPFSFFCLPAQGGAVTNVKDINLPENNCGYPSNKFDLSRAIHGQYVAVLWKDHWVRGIVTIESQFLIWLVDYGIYLRPNEKTVFVNLPAEDMKHPTKVFEASLYGITPVEIILTEMCEITNKVAMEWTNAAVEKARKLIASAVNIYLVPVAMLSTKINHVVIGNLYLRTKCQGVVKLEDALKEWPVFLKKDQELYIENLPKFYTHRRQHRLSQIKPAIPDLPTITLQISLADYTAICDNAPELELPECDDSAEVGDDSAEDCVDSAEEGSTLTYLETKLPQDRNMFKPTPQEIEKYANMYFMASGREYNVLNVLCNKARDLYMCVKYADQKYIGRATSRINRQCKQDSDSDVSTLK